MAESVQQWWSSVEAALSTGKPIASSAEDFDLACGHILGLLQDASRLLQEGSHATSAFLSITALEETAKISIGKYRKSVKLASRSKDPLYKHAEKHRISLGPTIAMGSRLQLAIGEARMLELIELAREGCFVRIRESALYVEQQGDRLDIPTQAIQPALSRELLLLAIEAFDDGLVGYTKISSELGRKTDEIFLQWGGV